MSRPAAGRTRHARRGGEAYLRRIAELKAFEPARFVPFRVDGIEVGAVRRDRVAELAEFDRVFEVGAHGVALSSGLETFSARTRALDGVARALSARGRLPQWRGEPYPVRPLDDVAGERAPLTEIERAAVYYFGVRAFGIHVNGFVRGATGLELWIARRSPEAAMHPGRLDDMVAGGQPAGLGPLETMVKEAGEEAAVPAALARTARVLPPIPYKVETPEGLSTATMSVFDLELPADFTPRNTDGELAGFRRLHLGEVLALVREATAFKPNCHLVIIDFALRHGALGLEPAERDALRRALRG